MSTCLVTPCIMVNKYQYLGHTYCLKFRPCVVKNGGNRFLQNYGTLRSEYDGTQWRTGGEVKGKLANGVGSQYSHTTSERGVSSITTADAHTSAASIRLNWLPRRFKWTRPFRRKTKCGFCACAIRFRTSSASLPMFAAFISQTTVMFHMHRDYTGRTVQGTVNGSCLQLWICNYVCMYCHLLMTKTLTLTVWEGVSVKNIDISMLNVGIYINSTQPNIYLTGTHPLRVTNIYRSVPPGPRS